MNPPPRPAVHPLGPLAGVLLFLLASIGLLEAHVGSPHIVVEGKAGAFSLRVVVRQPEVVPGLAEITVRVLEGEPSRITVLPLHWAADRNGAPRADVATRVPGETNLYTAQLWFMTRGAYGVEVAAEGDRQGVGRMIVPVNSVASSRKPMPAWLGFLAAALGLVLAAGIICIAWAGAREATLPDTPGTPPRGPWAGLRGGAIAALVVTGALFGGNFWWAYEEENHASHVVFHPIRHELSLQPGTAGGTLRLEFTDPRATNRNYSLVPDHGKLVHLFLIGTGSDPAMAHLHPVREGSTTYRAALPPLPAGDYRVFIDLTHELGVAETATNSLSLPLPPPPASAAPWIPTDPDDSWLTSGRLSSGRGEVGTGLTLELSASPEPRPGVPTLLRASVREASGAAAPLDPYMHMLGHALVLRSDGAVFAHVHPAGTLSLAAARHFAAKSGGEAAARAVEALCGDLEVLPQPEAAELSRKGEIGFPYVFPTPGAYLIWVQAKVRGTVVTGAFRLQVGPPAPGPAR